MGLKKKPTRKPSFCYQQGNHCFVGVVGFKEKPTRKPSFCWCCGFQGNTNKETSVLLVLWVSRKHQLGNPQQQQQNVGFLVGFSLKPTTPTKPWFSCWFPLKTHNTNKTMVLLLVLPRNPQQQQNVGFLVGFSLKPTTPTKRWFPCWFLLETHNTSKTMVSLTGEPSFCWCCGFQGNTNKETNILLLLWVSRKSQPENQRFVEIVSFKKKPTGEPPFVVLIYIYTYIYIYLGGQPLNDIPTHLVFG